MKVFAGGPVIQFSGSFTLKYPVREIQDNDVMYISVARRYPLLATSVYTGTPNVGSFNVRLTCLDPYTYSQNLTSHTYKSPFPTEFTFRTIDQKSYAFLQSCEFMRTELAPVSAETGEVGKWYALPIAFVAAVDRRVENYDTNLKSMFMVKICLIFFYLTNIFKMH